MNFTCKKVKWYFKNITTSVLLQLINYFVFFPAFACPGTLQYQACLPACSAPSCLNKEFEYEAVHCSGMSEGCMCPEGTVLHRPYSALCIPPVKCGKHFFLFLPFVFSVPLWKWFDDSTSKKSTHSFEEKFKSYSEKKNSEIVLLLLNFSVLFLFII